MITFRYHVVTLVAVFMAVGVGVLFGATFIDQNIVSGLKSTQARLGTRNETLRERIIALEKQKEGLIQFAGSIKDVSVAGQLKDRPVLLVVFDSTPAQLLEGTTQTLGTSGARITGTLTFTDRLGLADESARKDLATVLGTISGQADPLAELLVSRFVRQLQGQDAGVIQKLIDSGLVKGQLNPPPEPAGGPAPANPAVVVLAGQTSGAFNDRIIYPLLTRLGESAVVTAVAEVQTTERLLRRVRDDKLTVVTVDGAETAVGQTALVLGLKAALNGRFGSYGTGKGASTSLPPG